MVLTVQYIRFLRRTEGVEAARKYFVDARKSPNCTYHVYISYAMMAFCLDKDPKVIDEMTFFCCITRISAVYLMHSSPQPNNLHKKWAKITL